MKTFKEAYLAGKADSEDIDDWVSQWHDGYQLHPTLHEALGMTWEEYSKWGTTPSTLDTILWCWKAQEVVSLYVREKLSIRKKLSWEEPYDSTQFLDNVDKLLLRARQKVQGKSNL